MQGSSLGQSSSSLEYATESLFVHVRLKMNVVIHFWTVLQKTSENLRYIVGLVLSEGGAPVKAEDETLLESHGYKRVVFPAVKHAVVADFPYRSTLSCIFAVFRVYPALREYVGECLVASLFWNSITILELLANCYIHSS